jgi:IS5 family transposase
MRQERTIQATIFEVFAQHEIGCELKAMSQWLDDQRQLTGGMFAPYARARARAAGPTTDQ